MAYWTGKTGDLYDAKEGHGTHVGGTICGSLLDKNNPAARYGGIAPAAKLAVTDAEVQTASDGDGSMIFGDIYRDVYTKGRVEAGAELQSHSWGTQEYSYTGASGDVDRFLHANRQALFIWAAGNDGADRAMQSVGSPATAKNCLTVGATLAGVDAATKIRKEGHTDGSGKPSFPLNKKQLEDEPQLWSNAHVLHFSARGPCNDGRLKPDIILPGLVQSARSNGRLPNTNCCLHAQCSIKTDCPGDCSNKGQCVPAHPAPHGFRCLCEQGFCGNDCSIKTDSPTPTSCCPPSAGGATRCTAATHGSCEASRQGIPGSYLFPACHCASQWGSSTCATPRLASLATIPKWGTSMAGVCVFVCVCVCVCV